MFNIQIWAFFLSVYCPKLRVFFRIGRLKGYSTAGISITQGIQQKPLECRSGSCPEHIYTYISTFVKIKVIGDYFSYFHFYTKNSFLRKNENKRFQLPLALILINDIQDIILNSIQEVLAVSQTPCIMLTSAIL